MKLHRIYAIILRFTFHFRRSLDRMVDVFYWSVFDVAVWGLTGLYFVSLAPEQSNLLLMLISAILLWFLIYRAQYEVSGNLLQDLWDRNLVNLFVSPLTFGEWITAFVILGIVKSLIGFSFAIFIAFVLYKIQFFSLGFVIIPFAALLLMTGYWMGFFISGLILRFGTRIQAFAWTIVWVISPFVAIYYPLSILPGWAQVIGHLLPPSYVFETMRGFITTGILDARALYISFGLNLIYLTISFIFLRQSFKAVLKRGLVQVQ